MCRLVTKSTRLLLVFFGLAIGLNVQAALINFSVTGDVDDPIGTFSPNDFGLVLGNQIFATGTFDNTGFTGSGAEDFSLSSISLTVGTASFTIGDDTRGSGFPLINFQDGQFVGINFDAVYQTFGFFNSAGATGVFTGFDDGFGSISGTWDATTYVPVPAAIWLFGSGLIGLVGIARKKRVA